MSELSGSTAFDECLQALGSVERRRLLLALLDEDVVDATRAEGGGGQVTMCHCHLPMLDAQGFVDWERGAYRARRGPRFDEVAPLLRLLTDRRTELPGGVLEPAERV